MRVECIIQNNLISAINIVIVVVSAKEVESANESTKCTMHFQLFFIVKDVERMQNA